MAGSIQADYDELMRAMANRFAASRHSRRSSRTSPVQCTRRHSARIEKPRSHQPSPITPERRRISNAPRYVSSLDDHYRRMMGLDDDDDYEQDEVVNQYQFSTRPVSWHPGYYSSHEISDNGYSSFYSKEQSLASQYLSYQNSPFYQNAVQASRPELAWAQYMRGDFNATATQNGDDHNPTSWFDGNEAQEDDRINSALSNSQDNEDREERSEREQSVELVGLGLYDPPGFTVKIGSKLEEECDPPEFDEDGNENEESSEEEEEELPKPEDTKVAQAAVPVVNMSGQSFFAGADENYEGNWWSAGDSKQLQPQVNEVSYSWV
ncbi:uncharacterized protein PV09_05012 [Verruconis gallopava]|uniref:Uncharacterized protein n=1 Tax=Verruconis gallopava TaxID=253628 RepID=A0A0D1YST5_9PEZI|nr:uncharacterized protein PV09_05012 [Verruconis gallopava]KIW03697.1 hypothetical protein PV09_05012 [Verruconis gallopava]